MKTSLMGWEWFDTVDRVLGTVVVVALCTLVVDSLALVVEHEDIGQGSEVKIVVDNMANCMEGRCRVGKSTHLLVIRAAINCC